MPPGRSLRDLKLDGRLMTLSAELHDLLVAFDGLPPAVRQDAVYRRLWQVLSGRDRPKYGHLTAADRRAVLDILRATKTDLPEVVRLDRRRALTGRRRTGRARRPRGPWQVFAEPRPRPSPP